VVDKVVWKLFQPKCDNTTQSGVLLDLSFESVEMKPFNSKRNKHKEYFANQALVLLITKVIVGILSFIWILAVLKVYLLDLKRNGHRGDPDQLLGDPARFNIFARSPLELNPIFNRNGDAGVKTFISLYDEKKRKLSDKGAKVVVPTSSEWAQIRASPDYRVSGNREDGNTEGVPYKNVIEHDIIQASALVWPPVQHDGTILATDGIDIMPVIGLKVPRFYIPDSEFEMNKVGSKVNGQDTIFLMIASYRDFQCRETITSAYMRSDHPERLFIGAVDQVVPGDIGCLDIDIPCSVDDTQPICKYRDQISVFKMDAMYATGPVTG
jgi:Glycosyltransferase (GlcNAc)